MGPTTRYTVTSDVVVDVGDGLDTDSGDGWGTHGEGDGRSGSRDDGGRLHGVCCLSLSVMILLFFHGMCFGNCECWSCCFSVWVFWTWRLGFVVSCM